MGLGGFPLLPLIRMMLVKKELKKEFRTSSMTTILENMVIFGMKDTIITTFPRLNDFRGDGYNFYKMVFYSDEFTYFPLSLDLTGKSENFKITITDSYLEEESRTTKDEIHYLKYSKSNTYDSSNKEAYINDILNYHAK